MLQSEAFLFCFAQRALALRFLAFAAAFEALEALSLRCFAVSDLARANPPRRAIFTRSRFKAAAISALKSTIEADITPCSAGWQTFPAFFS